MSVTRSLSARPGRIVGRRVVGGPPRLSLRLARPASRSALTSQKFARLAVASCLGLTIAFGAAPLLAQGTTLAITEVRGAIQEDVTDGLEAALQKNTGLRVITLDEWQAAAKGARLSPTADRPEVARRLGANRLLRAKVTRKDRRWQLTVEVADARGNRLKRWQTRAKKVRRLDYLIRTELNEALSQALAVAATASAPAPGLARSPDIRAPSAPPQETVQPVRLGVLSVTGSDRVSMRLDRLLDKYQAFDHVPSEQIEATAASMNADLDTAPGRAEVARALRLQAWLSVRARSRSNRSAATGRLYSGHSGKLVDTVRGRGPTEWKALSGMLKLLRTAAAKTKAPAPDAGEAQPPPAVAAAPPPAPRPERRSAAADRPRADSSVEAEAPPAERKEGRRSWTPLAISLGISLQRRDLTYNDDAFDTLRTYELGGAPAIAADARWYPAAHFVGGFAAHLGVEGRLRYLLAVASEDSAGNRFDTESFDAWGGIRGRIPLYDHEIGLGIGLGHHTFGVQVPDDGPALPDVAYTYLRAGADARFGLPADFHVYIAGGWRQVFSAGDITSDRWFPDASLGGIDAQIALGWAFFGGVEVRLGAEYTRYFFSLNPEVGNEAVAGGALDQYIGGTLDLMWSLGE